MFFCCHFQRKRIDPNDSDENFVPGVARVKVKGRKSKVKRKTQRYESSGDEEFENHLAELANHESDSEPLHWSSPSETEVELDSDGSEYQPEGRNAKRAALIKRMCIT